MSELWANYWPVVLVAFSAAVVGDNIGFWLGRVVARPRLAAGKRVGLALAPIPIRFATVGIDCRSLGPR